MAWRRLLTKVAKQQLEHPYFIDLSGRSCLTLCMAESGGGSGLRNFQERSLSSYVGNFARRMRDADGLSDSILPRNDPERVIRLFESQPALHSNPSALSEYVKALVKVDKLDGSQLLNTLQKAPFAASTDF